MAKTVRKILSPSVVQAVDGLLQSRHDNDMRVRDDAARNDALLTPDGTTDVTHREAQRGRGLLRSAFVAKIHKLNPNLWYEQSLSYPKQGGLYIKDAAKAPFDKRMVAAFPHDFIGEFSVRITVPEVIPSAGFAPYWKTIQQVDQQEPGWRSVLLKLIMDGLITPSGAEREFNISQGRSSKHWQTATN